MTINHARRRRARLALWSLPPAVLALAVAAKLLSVGVLGGAAVESYTAGDGNSVAGDAAWLRIANLVEPHKALFASGDAHVLAGDFDAARTDFEAALLAGAGGDECKVRVNLVLSIEKLGDAAANPGAAAGLFREALAAAAASPPQCRAGGSANASGEGAALDSAEERLTDKLSKGEGQNGEAQQPSGESPAPQQEQLKKLEESAQQAQRERAEGQERGEYLHGPDDGPRVDRPW
ncbi:hypothetical protein J2Y66_001576 [Paenarthrobacter nitroguajacolicus]|uniref:hypothetical protein n=1 Tax=Paenarthrobacter TaxID=1742992 RepID=UPI002865ABFF|nr:hypothetical protein [Paenarthrobacter nitroguajacolicus]MDR6987094.1 hypothetical protein [Paenarthrobacter nitroguajacolicus]